MISTGVLRSDAIEDTATARGAGLCANSGRSPSSVATAPKKLSERLVSGGPPPALATTASIHPPGETRHAPDEGRAAVSGRQIGHHIGIVKVAANNAAALTAK